MARGKPKPKRKAIWKAKAPKERRESKNDPTLSTHNGFAHTSRMGRLSPIAPEVHLGKLALSAGICQSHLSKIIGGTRVPSVGVIKRIAESLHVTVDEVLRKIDNQDW